MTFSATSDAAWGGHTEMIIEHLSQSSFIVRNSTILCFLARPRVSELRSFDTQYAVCPAFCTVAARNTPIAPGCKKPMCFLFIICSASMVIFSFQAISTPGTKSAVFFWPIPLRRRISIAMHPTDRQAILYRLQIAFTKR